MIISGNKRMSLMLVDYHEGVLEMLESSDCQQLKQKLRLKIMILQILAIANKRDNEMRTAGG